MHKWGVWFLQRVIEGKIKGGDRSDRKTRKKTYEATG
jgi:hypothetical protein